MPCRTMRPPASGMATRSLVRGIQPGAKRGTSARRFRAWSASVSARAVRVGRRQRLDLPHVGIVPRRPQARRARRPGDRGSRRCGPAGAAARAPVCDSDRAGPSPCGRRSPARRGSRAAGAAPGRAAARARPGRRRRRRRRPRARPAARRPGPGSKRGRAAASPRSSARTSAPVPPSARPVTRRCGPEQGAWCDEDHRCSVPTGCDSPCASHCLYPETDMASALVLASAGNTAFFVIFGIFVVAMLALVVIVIMWAVRHDMAGPQGVARPPAGTDAAAARPARRILMTGTLDGATGDGHSSRVRPRPRSPTASAPGGRNGVTAAERARPPGAGADGLRPRRRRQPGRRPGGHAPGAHPARHPGRPRLRRLGRRHQRRVLRRPADPGERRADGRHLARREGHRHLPPRPARRPVGLLAEAARPCTPTPGCGPSSRRASTTRTSRTPPSRSRW